MTELTWAEKKEVVRKLYDAANRRDIEGALEQIHPEMELRLALELVEPVDAGGRRELRGHDGVRQFFEMLAESWDEVSTEVTDLVEGRDGYLLGFETWTVRGPQGIEIDTEMVDVYGFKDGLISRCDGFRDKNEAMAAFGVDR
jgi:ketosteroid isomerase-like protein